MSVPEEISSGNKEEGGNRRYMNSKGLNKLNTYKKHFEREKVYCLK